MNFKGKKILVVSPHPDDEIIGCGGLLLRAKKEGASLFVLFGAVGKCRQLVTGKTTPETRLKETEAVAKFVGYKYKFLFIGDEFMRLDSLPQKTLIDSIEDYISEIKPDLVLLPYRHSYDQDHRAMFTAAMTALRPVPQSLRHLPKMVMECEEPYNWHVGQSFEPNMYVDITAFVEEKITALKLHATQFREEPFARSGKNLKRLAELNGKAVGVKAAEAFRLLRYYL